MNTYNVYLPHGEKLSIEADDYEVQNERVVFFRDDEPINLYINKTGVCVLPEDTSLEAPDKNEEDEVDLFKSI